MGDRQSAIELVVKDLETWGGRFLAAARAGEPARAVEAVAGLVEWLGHDLVDAFRWMDVGTWEALSETAEDLFRTLREARAGIGAPDGRRGMDLPAAGAAIEALLRRAQAIRDAEISRCR
jgi:hypothetical protein